MDTKNLGVPRCMICNRLMETPFKGVPFHLRPQTKGAYYPTPCYDLLDTTSKRVCDGCVERLLELQAHHRHRMEEARKAAEAAKVRADRERVASVSISSPSITSEQASKVMAALPSRIEEAVAARARNTEAWKRGLLK